MAEPFAWPVRVYWEDTDAGGVVYHAQYLAFMERARSEWMRGLGLGQDLLRSRDDLVFVVRAMTTDFRAPARLDDQLQVAACLVHAQAALHLDEFAIARHKIQRLGSTPEHRTAHLALAVLERKVTMPAGGA